MSKPYVSPLAGPPLISYAGVNGYKCLGGFSSKHASLQAHQESMSQGQDNERLVVFTHWYMMAPIPQILVADP